MYVYMNNFLGWQKNALTYMNIELKVQRKHYKACTSITTNYFYYYYIQQFLSLLLL